MKIEKFPLIRLKGGPAEIGNQHGTLLKERIHKSISFYTDVTKTLDNKRRRENETRILDYAKHFRQIIYSIAPRFSKEIEGIADGADVDPLWIYAINARSEIMSNMENGSSECTALYFAQSKILAQNWDWAADFEDLSVIMQIKLNDGTEILQVTEPGMIGKIGFNNHGLGVLLNFLHVAKPLKGFPIHLILRSILEMNSIDEAISFVNRLNIGCSGNIIVADNSGGYHDIEFVGDDLILLDNIADSFTHTNHFLHNINLNDDPENLQSSYSRYDMASKLISQLKVQSMDNIKAILADQSNDEFPICRQYIQGKTMQNVGTVCTLIMDLINFKLHITKGSPLKNKFSIVSLNNL